MERAEAIARLTKLAGQDLRVVAEQHGVTVWTPHVAPGDPVPAGAKLNKGWAGQTIERVLDLPLNSSRAPNFGSWELKIIPLKHLGDGSLAVKETMAITMLDLAGRIEHSGGARVALLPAGEVAEREGGAE